MYIYVCVCEYLLYFATLSVINIIYYNRHLMVFLPSISKITDFKLSHKDKDDPNYLDLSKDKEYECIDNEENPSRLHIYTRRDKAKKKGIKDVQLSFTDAEELRLFTDHYEKIGRSVFLSVYQPAWFITFMIMIVIDSHDDEIDEF